MPIVLDSRAPWWTLTALPSTVYPSYRLTQWQYLPPELAGNDVNVYISVADEAGFKVMLDGSASMDPSHKFFIPINPLVNMGVLQSNGGQTILYTKSDPAKLGEVDFNQTAQSSFDPGKGQVGPYSVSIYDQKGRLPSDMVDGMGLPLRHHVVYSLGFQRVLTAHVCPSGQHWDDTLQKCVDDTSPTLKQQLQQIDAELQQVIGGLT